MSAWAELVSRDGSDEWLELCSRALEEVQRETSRRNAEKIRESTLHLAGTVTGDSVRRVVNELAADLIDPEVSK
ncbi:hypothetical protein [Streptomyces sp. DH12]|uniref:hypothetical protein n=1 Tax=Streptomyces sp. DH12 TaxID=2857010 RepID=UPI001E63822C|nr:hypothetical protein [Streptomyces sp. DH12]